MAEGTLQPTRDNPVYSTLKSIQVYSNFVKVKQPIYSSLNLESTHGSITKATVHIFNGTTTSSVLTLRKALSSSWCAKNGTSTAS
jgi:hypothetical protein